jgi:tripartite-type tricarboxylate transporter receptor subunit TctC
MNSFVSIISLFSIVFGLSLGSPSVQAQPFPSHPIQFVIPLAPGDAVDIIGRSVAEELSKILKVPVVPVNKPGGASTIGTDFVAKSKKDGYTLLYGVASGIVYSPAFNPEMTPYDPIRDLESLGLHIINPSGMWVQAESPWKNFFDVMEYSQKNPGKFRAGTLGVGSTSHFQLEIVKSLTGVDITMVPFKGASPTITALLGGHIEAGFSAVALILPHYKSKKLRGIFLDQKVPEMPDIPTLPQLGYKRDLPLAYWAFFAPAGIPEEVKKVLVPALEKVTKNPELIAKIEKMSLISNYKSPAEFKNILIEEYENARAVVKKMGITK